MANCSFVTSSNFLPPSHAIAFTTHVFVARNGGRAFSLDSTNITYVFSVPEVISSVTKITLFLSLFGSLVSHESWNFTIFGCCNCFSISASSLNLARSAFEYLSLKERKMYKTNVRTHITLSILLQQSGEKCIFTVTKRN